MLGASSSTTCQCSDLPWGLSDDTSKQVPLEDPTFGWGVQNFAFGGAPPVPFEYGSL